VIEPLTLAIGIGLIVCLIFIEFLGLSVGGLVVPGYLALSLDTPFSIVITLVVAFVAYGIIQFLSSYVILFGRRRIILTILVAFILGAFMRGFTGQELSFLMHGEHAFHVIGYIIPGLIAISIDREGALETVTMMITASVMVRLVLILLIGNQLLT